MIPEHGQCPGILFAVFSAEENRNKEKWKGKVFLEKNGLPKMKKTIFFGEKMNMPVNQGKTGQKKDRAKHGLF